jgi:hypothetical protein
VFVIEVQGDKEGFDTEVARVLEWSQADDDWRELDDDESITDPCLAQPLPVRALRDAAEADNHVARTLIGKHNPIIADYRAEGEALGLAEGEARGKMLGATQELRRSIATLCRVLDIPLTAERQRQLDAMGHAELLAASADIERHRAWPL